MTWLYDTLGTSWPLLVIVGIVAVKAFANLFERPEERTPAEVAATLRGVIDGTCSFQEWDAFISIPIKEPRLDAVRLRCVHLSDEFPPSEGEDYCSARSHEVLRGLIAQIEATA